MNIKQTIKNLGMFVLSTIVFVICLTFLVVLPLEFFKGLVGCILVYIFICLKKHQSFLEYIEEEKTDFIDFFDRMMLYNEDFNQENALGFAYDATAHIIYNKTVWKEIYGDGQFCNFDFKECKELSLKEESLIKSFFNKESIPFVDRPKLYPPGYDEECILGRNFNHNKELLKRYIRFLQNSLKQEIKNFLSKYKGSKSYSKEVYKELFIISMIIVKSLRYLETIYHHNNRLLLGLKRCACKNHAKR